jgi:hypothetical protein
MSNAPTRPSRYLEYLPAIYGRAQHDGEQPFMASFLKIFEKTLSGIPDFSDTPNALQERKGIRELLDSRVIGTLFHPRLSFLFAGDPTCAKDFIPRLSIDDSAPPVGDDQTRLALLGNYIDTPETVSTKDWLHGYLDWLANTVALTVDGNWSIDMKRFMSAQALALFRARGTMQGMQWLLNAWFGLDADAPIQPASNGPLKLFGISVKNVGFQPIYIGDAPDGYSFQLADVPGPNVARLADLVCVDATEGSKEVANGYQAWHFVVLLAVADFSQDNLLFLPSEDDQFTLQQLKGEVALVVNEFKPVLTEYDLVTNIALRPPPPPPPPRSASTSPLFGDPMDHDDAPSTLARVQYKPGMYLTADDLSTEQRYFQHKVASIYKLLFEPGIVGGADCLAVKIGEGNATSVEISAGSAIDPDGALLEFTGTRTPLVVSQQLKPKPDGALEDMCYVYIAYCEIDVGASRVADGVQFIFSREIRSDGVLLGRLTLEGDRVVEVLMEPPYRRYAKSRLINTQ